MNCPLDPETISRFLDGDLTEEGLRNVEAHVAACERCAAELAAMRRAQALLRETCAMKAPNGLRDQIRAELQEQPSEPASRGRIVRFWAARAAAIDLTCRSKDLPVNFASSSSRLFSADSLFFAPVEESSASISSETFLASFS